MHYHCEIVLPAETEDIEAAVKTVMHPFRENDRTDDDDCLDSFWDFYVLGGRFAGRKQLAALDQQKVDAFNEWCLLELITCHGFRCGKQSLHPSSQIEKVDAKWNELFPQADGTKVACPIFSHSNDQYARNGAESGMLVGDISKLGESGAVKCCRVIIASRLLDKDAKPTGHLEAKFMLTKTAWNIVNHMPVRWDGTIGGAIEQFVEYSAAATPNDDWICVTVDYHS
jgi:hypothetical protein